MVRKLVIALAAAAAVIAGTTMTASAMHGWHGGFRAGFVARPFGFHKHGLASIISHSLTASRYTAA
jgi:hypothetical protein